MPFNPPSSAASRSGVRISAGHAVGQAQARQNLVFGLSVVTWPRSAASRASRTTTARSSSSAMRTARRNEPSTRTSRWARRTPSPCSAASSSDTSHGQILIRYPPANGVSEVDMNDVFRSRAPEVFTFVNKGDDIISVSYTSSTSSGGVASFDVVPGNQEHADNIASKEGAYEFITLQRGKSQKSEKYAAANSPIDVNAAFAGPASFTGAVSYKPVNRGRDTIILVYIDANGIQNQVSVVPDDPNVPRISLGEGTHTAQRFGDKRTFTLSLVRGLADGAGELDVSELYNRALYANNTHTVGV
ncbi:hypothetical protein DFH11DRAFT_973017 [Phellopilus nigrolimitatus]|nr:hypothetical protein DFH11DRAFT_973017 [Phellopilus nigrolimitatus]